MGRGRAQPPSRSLSFCSELPRRMLMSLGVAPGWLRPGLPPQAPELQNELCRLWSRLLRIVGNPWLLVRCASAWGKIQISHRGRAAFARLRTLMQPAGRTSSPTPRAAPSFAPTLLGQLFQHAEAGLVELPVAFSEARTLLLKAISNCFLAFPWTSQRSTSCMPRFLPTCLLLLAWMRGVPVSGKSAYSPLSASCLEVDRQGDCFSILGIDALAPVWGWIISIF